MQFIYWSAMHPQAFILSLSQRPARLVSFAALAVSLLWFAGCNTQPDREEDAKPSDAPRVSDVPLRIHVVGELTSPEVIERRWLASSEQPISLRSQSVDEFLAADECKADVLLFPSHLLGELVQRDWIIKLPAEAKENFNANEDESAERTFMAAPLAAGQYGGVEYALPLGCSVPQWIASDALANQLQTTPDESDPLLTLEQLRDFLNSLPSESEDAVSVDEQAIDRMAVVDRFLVLMHHLSDRDSRYGMLFDIDTMQPRFNVPEAVGAVEMLQMLARQPSGMLSVVGSHDMAWTWAATHEQPVVALASTTLLSREALELADGQELRLEGTQPINVGRGLIVGLSANCRQTFHSLSFIQWLSQGSTSQVLAPVLQGVDPVQPLSIESTAWRLRQNIVPGLGNDTISQEPRLPQAHAARSILADALLAILLQRQAASAALDEATQRWSEVSTLSREQFEREYKKSLGLRTY